MKTFCVAFHSSFEGSIHQRIVIADSIEDACFIELSIQGFDLTGVSKTLGDIGKACGSDFWITAADLTNVKIL